MANPDTVTELEVSSPPSPSLPPPEPAAVFESTAGGVDAEVLKREEHTRRVIALKALLVGYALVACALVAVSLDRPTYWLLAMICGGNVVITAAMLLFARARPVSDLVSAGNGITSAVFALAGCVYFGVSSAPVVALPVLVYYFGMGDSALRRRAVLGVVLVGFSLVSALTLVGLIPIRGVATHDSLGRLGVGIMSLVVLQVLLLTYWLARKSRRTTLEAMAALEQARRRIRQRDALLDEAHADFDRVFAGARAGRYSGQRIEEFQVGDVIGRGAIAEVYAAEHMGTGQPAALKVLHPHLEVERGHVERFFREVSVTSALSSPHIPRILASGFTADGGPFLAMERLVGTDLGSLLRRQKRLGLREIEALVTDVASALAIAHAAGVVHRDIKPQNLFCTDDSPPCWKVLDFGVSKLLASTGTLTGGAAVGTPAYMAPEQVLGVDVDARADVFALGCVVYRALTGRPAFSGPSAHATMMRVSNWQPAKPSELAHVHGDVDLFVALALAKSADERLGSATEFARAFKAACRGKLDGRLRSAAERILSEHPWGSEVEGDNTTAVLAR